MVEKDGFMMEKTRGPMMSFASGVALGSLMGLGTGYALFRSGGTNGETSEEKPDDSRNQDSEKARSRS